ERESCLVLVALQLRDELEPPVERLQHLPVEGGDPRAQLVDDRIRHRPTKTSEVGLDVRGIVIRRYGYVTRAATASVSDGVRSRTKMTTRERSSVTWSTRRTYPVDERGPAAISTAFRWAKSIRGGAGASPGITASR